MRGYVTVELYLRIWLRNNFHQISAGSAGITCLSREIRHSLNARRIARTSMRPLSPPISDV